MPQLFIPDVGTVIKLTKDWTFSLRHEYRNSSLLKAAGLSLNNSEYGADKLTPFSIPKGTELVVDRVYIRRGLREFSSITFHVKSSPLKELNKKGIRFWAKLNDVNNISYSLVIDKAKVYPWGTQKTEEELKP